MNRRKLIATPAAKRDIRRIVDWYHETLGARAAAKVERTLQKGLRSATTIHPEAATRADLPIGIYRVVAKAHLVIFRIEGDTALVVRVMHGARDVPTALEELE